MKNKYRILTLSFLIITFFACETEESNSPALDDDSTLVEESATSYDFRVKVINDVLSFETREDFDKAIEYLANLGDDNFESWEKEMSFISMRSVFSEAQLEEVGINDNLLAVFLNPEGLISFGESTFKVDYKSNEVIMISNETFSSKSSFETSKGKRVFQADADIFGILDGTVSENEGLGITAKGCNGNDPGTKFRNVGSDQYEMKVVYQRFWPLYSLQAKIKRKDGVAAVEETYIGVDAKGNSFYKKKRSSSCIRFAGSSDGGLGREYNIRAYYSSRQLQAYDFDIQFFGSNTRGIMTEFSRITCSSC